MSAFLPAHPPAGCGILSLMQTHAINNRNRNNRLTQTRRSWLTHAIVPLALAGLALALYLTTRTQVHTFDALSYIRDVDERSGFFFHPHHLLYSPTGWLFWQGWRWLGYVGNSEVPLQVLNSLVGVGCGVGLYALLLRLTQRWWAAATAAGLLLANFGMWYFSVEVEVYTLALAWLLATLALLIQQVYAPQPATAPLIGLTMGMAALYHQANGLLVPIVCGALLLTTASWRTRLRRLLQTGVVAGGVVALGYALAGFGYYGYRSLGEQYRWMFFYAQTGWWGQPTQDRLTDLLTGLNHTISMQQGWWFWLAIAALLLPGLPALVRRMPRLVALCLGWLVVYGSFFAWWEGENIEFWIGTLLPLWVLVGMSLAQLDNLPRLRRLGPAGLLVPLLLAAHNYPLVAARGDPTRDLQRQLVAQVEQLTLPSDLIVSSGGVMELYLPYYADRINVRTLNGVIFEEQGDIARALARLRQEIDASLHAGLQIVVSSDALELPPHIRRRYPITQAHLDAFWQPYRAVLQPVVTHDGIIYFWAIPPADAFATGAGWHWQHFDQGWNAANVSAASFTPEAGWCFHPGTDPMLISPGLTLDAARYRTLEITMRSRAAGQTAQLFYADIDGLMDNSRSLTWELRGDDGWHTYSLDLRAAPGWQGTITRLRLDPVAVGDGSPADRICITRLRLR
ncbi:MAG: hypothetical protein ACLFVO_24355 [Chloroflexaceae bacterium]